MLFLLLFWALCDARRCRRCRRRRLPVNDDSLDAETYKGGWRAGFTPTPTPCPWAWKDEIRKDIEKLENKLDSLRGQIEEIQNKTRQEEDRHVETVNNLTGQFHQQIDLLQWEIDNYYKKYEAAEAAAKEATSRLDERRTNLENEVAELEQRKRSLNRMISAANEGYQKFTLEQQKLDVSNRARRKTEHNLHVDRLAALNQQVELTRETVAELIGVVKSMKEELKKKKKQKKEEESENDDLDDEFQKLWEDEGDTGNEGGPNYTPMPAILPPEDDIENPRRVLQFPQYCCRCELRKKLTDL